MIITTLYIFIDQLYMISNFKYNIVNCFLWEYKVWGNRPEMIDTFVCLNTVLWNVFFFLQYKTHYKHSLISNKTMLFYENIGILF